MANTETTINAVIHPKYNDTPIDIEKTIKALERNNFVVHYFETGTEAISYLKDRIQNKHVAIGGLSHVTKTQCLKSTKM